MFLYGVLAHAFVAADMHQQLRNFTTYSMPENFYRHSKSLRCPTYIQLPYYVKWTTHQLRDSRNENPSEEQIRNKLGSILYRIRFPTMTLEDFIYLFVNSGIEFNTSITQIQGSQ